MQLSDGTEIFLTKISLERQKILLVEKFNRRKPKNILVEEIFRLKFTFVESFFDLKGFRQCPFSTKNFDFNYL